MESNWGEIMPELAVRHSAHIPQHRKSAALGAVRSCHLLVGRERPARRAADWQLLTARLLGNAREGQDILLARQADLLQFLSEAFLSHKATCCIQPQPCAAKG